MNNTTELFPINKEINVNAFYFKNSSHHMRSYPRQMEFDGSQVSFADGLSYLVRTGQQIVQLFDMTDGDNTYRLRHTGDQWTLVGMKAGI
jgi:hypothetical protein